MGTVAEAAIIGDGSQRVIGMLEHGFCLPEPIILNINQGRAVEKLLEIADVGGTGHTGYGIQCLKLDFFTVVGVNVFYRFQQVEQITLAVLIGGFFIPDHIADFGDDIECQIFLFLLGIVFLLFFQRCQFVENPDQIVVFGNVYMKKAVDQIVLISQHRIDVEQNVISGQIIQVGFVLSEKILVKQKMKDGIVFGIKDIAVADLRRHNENVAVGNIKFGVLHIMLSVAGHHDVQLIKIVGMNGRVQKGLIVKICLYQLLGLKDLVIGKVLQCIHKTILIFGYCATLLYNKNEIFQYAKERQNFPYRRLFVIGILVQLINTFKQYKIQGTLIIYK